MSFAIYRTAKLKSFGEIGGSLSHNYRNRHTPNADTAKEHLNEHSLLTNTDCMAAIKNRIPEKHRKDAVLCIEHLITASPDWLGWGTEKEAAFFEKSLNFLKEKYGEKNIISHSIHRDETTPHLIIYVVPVDEKGGLNAKKWLGGRAKLSQTQTAFANEVKNLGLERGVEKSKAKHKTISQFYSEINTLEKSEVEPFTERPELPEKGFLESGASYGERVLEVVYSHIEADLQQVKKENLELKNLVEEQKQEIGRLRHFDRELRAYREYCRVFPKEKNGLDAQFLERVKTELEKRDFQGQKMAEFDKIYKDFSCEKLNKFVKNQRLEYIKGNSSGYGQVLKAKYGFLQEEVKKGDFLEGASASVFERDLALEPVAISENAKIVKAVQGQNEKAKTDYYAQDELRRREEYLKGYSSRPSNPSPSRDRGFEP